jgi:hypothetical protein
MACESDDGEEETPPVTCEADGVTYEVGEQFGDADGCNTCTCGEDGEATCTLLGCPDVYDPCAGLACGDACSSCPPEDDDCTETGEEKACNNEGVCEGSFDVSQCGADACADVVCEEPGPFCDQGAAWEGIVYVCDPGTGECVDAGFPQAPQDCPFGCENGACLPDPNESCEQTEEVCGPAMGAPNYLCDDGVTVAGPGPCEVQEDGICGWTMVECPEDDGTCEPKTEFLAADGCNTCTCPESGLKEGAPCTKMACVCSSNDDCGGTAYCDWSGDDCGAWGQKGICKAKPTECVAGGPGACGCDGSWANNDCELNAQGMASMKYGGCQSPDPEAVFACGEEACDLTTELCNISMNDIVGDNEPEYYATCSPLPEGCAQGDCACLNLDQWSECYDGQGVTMTFYPGG